MEKTITGRVIEMAAEKKLKIGAMLFQNDEHPYFGKLKEGIDDKLKEGGAEGYYLECGFTIDSQVKVLDELIKKKCDAIIIAPSCDQRVIEKVNEAADKGIFIITVDSDLPESKRSCFVGVNPYQTGEIAAGIIGRLSEKKAEVCVVAGNRNFNSHKERARGFREYLEKHFPGITVDAVVYCEDDDYKCYEEVQNVLAAFPMIRGLAFVAGGIYGGCKALYQLTTSMDFNVVTIGEIATTRDFMEKGVIDMTIVSNPYPIGRTAASMALRLLKGESVDEFNYMENAVKTKECLL